MESQVKFLVILMGLLLVISQSTAFWCTRSRSETIVHEVTEMQTCNQSYTGSCSLFSWSECTYYELVECPVTKNVTLTRYFIVEECCRGFKLDPINNITCISTEATTYKSGLAASRGHQGFNPGVTVSGFKPDRQAISSTKSGHRSATEKENLSSQTDSSNDGVGVKQGGNETDFETDSSLGGDAEAAVESDEDGLLFSLSQGAYAGILCSLLFVMCVCILIMVRIRKRSKKTKAKRKAVAGNAESVEMGVTQKMLSTPA